MTKYIHKSRSVDCPECGEVTHELFNVKSQSGQEVTMCNECGPIDMIRITGWKVKDNADKP